MIWPRDRFADVLLHAGVGAALPLLVERIASRRGAPEDPTDPTSAIAIARRIVGAWEEAPGYPTHRSLGKAPDRGEMVRLLGRMGDASLLEQFIAGVVTRQFDGTEAAALAEGAEILGPQKCGKLFTALARENARVFHAGCVTLLHGMVRHLGPGLDAKWKAPLSRIAAAIIVEFPKIEVGGGPYAGPEWWRTQKARPMDAAEVVDLLESLRALDSVELHTAAVAVIRGALAVFDPVTVVVPALQQLPAALGTELTSDAVRRPLWLHAAEFLLARSERPPSQRRDGAPAATGHGRSLPTVTWASRFTWWPQGIAAPHSITTCETFADSVPVEAGCPVRIIGVPPDASASCPTRRRAVSHLAAR